MPTLLCKAVSLLPTACPVACSAASRPAAWPMACSLADGLQPGRWPAAWPMACCIVCVHVCVGTQKFFRVCAHVRVCMDVWRVRTHDPLLPFTCRHSPLRHGPSTSSHPSVNTRMAYVSAAPSAELLGWLPRIARAPAYRRAELSVSTPWPVPCKHSPAWHSTALHGATQHCTALHCTAWHDMAPPGTCHAVQLFAAARGDVENDRNTPS